MESLYTEIAAKKFLQSPLDSFDIKTSQAGCFYYDNNHLLIVKKAIFGKLIARNEAKKQKKTRLLSSKIH